MTDKQKNGINFTRRQILEYGVYGGIAGLTGGLWLGGCSSGRDRRPNVVLIVLDTARADRFGCMGYERDTSPNIDSIFSEGTIFENTYSTACWTLPSHGSLFTGLYPTQAGATSETLHLPKVNRTIAQTLQEGGYKTAGFCCNGWLSKERGFAQGFDEYHEMWREENRVNTAGKHLYSDQIATEKIINWLRQQNKSKNPFFTFINLNGIHLPYQPTEPFLSRFVGNRGYNNEEVNRIAAVKSWWAYLGGKVAFNERDFRIMSDLYDGEVALADTHVGRIADELRTLRMLDDTVFIVTSDHGENLGEHGRFDHNLSMYETTLHIPLMMRYPKAFSAAVRVKDLVSNTDIAPTILDLCGVGGMDKLKPEETSLARKERRRRNFVVSGNERPMSGIGLMKEQYPEFDVRSIDYRMRAIRSGSYKLIWKINVGTQLFDLQTDPQELNDLAGKDIATRNKLNNMLVSWMRRTPAVSNIKSLQGQDEENLKLLRSLGYIK